MINNVWDVSEYDTDEHSQWNEMSAVEKRCVNGHPCGHIVVDSEEIEYKNKIFYDPLCVNLSTEFFQWSACNV